MKIALLTFNHAVYEQSFSAIAASLIDRGHVVQAFYHPEDPRPTNAKVGLSHCRWWEFEFASLEAFNPDRVLVFNGSFGWCNAATKEISKRWTTRYAELGWLPQKNQMYIDSKGPGARSTLFDAPVPECDPAETVARLKQYYTPTAGFPHKDYILIPCQLEADTSILYDSSRFKTMHSVVGFVKRHLPGIPIVIKKHPAELYEYKFPGCIEVEKEVPFHNLIPNARFVIGINSTTLIESLVFEKPVMCLGSNVASNKGVFLEGEEAFWTPDRILTWEPNIERIHQVLHFLKTCQFPMGAPRDEDLQRALG